MQLLKLSISLPDDSRLQVVDIYRAPDFSIEALLVQLAKILSQSIEPCIVIGDLNVDLLKTTNPNTDLIVRFFSARQFHQCVEGHTSGPTVL
jgi:hypothetical protein